MFKSVLKYSVVCMILLLLSLSLTCKRSVAPTYTDVDAIMNYIKSRPDIFSVSEFNPSPESPSPIFYREITKRENWIRISFREPDTTYMFRYANVIWDDSIRGVFHVSISGKEYTKEFQAFSRVRAHFEQWGTSGDIYRGWLLMEVSNGEVYSLPNTVGFSRLWIDTLGSDEIINHGDIYKLEDVLNLKNSQSVKLTIRVANPADNYSLHIKEGSDWRKISFTRKDSTNEFTATWTPSTGDFNTYKHAYIDCLDSLTLADTTFRYDSRAWAIIYKIRK